MPPSNSSSKGLSPKAQREYNRAEGRRLLALYDTIGWEHADPSLFNDDPIMLFRHYKAIKDWHSMVASRWPRLKTYGLYKLGRVQECYDDPDMRVGMNVMDLIKIEDKDAAYWEYIRKISKIEEDSISYADNSLVQKAKAELAVREHMITVSRMDLTEVIKLLDAESPFIREIAKKRIKDMEVDYEKGNGPPADQ